MVVPLAKGYREPPTFAFVHRLCVPSNDYLSHACKIKHNEQGKIKNKKRQLLHIETQKTFLVLRHAQILNTKCERISPKIYTILHHITKRLIPSAEH